MYDIYSHITTLEDVENFVKFLYIDMQVAFHPDDDFAEYVSMETNEPSFNSEEIALFNRLTEECFNVCETANVDIYEVMGKYNPLMK